MYHFVSEHVSLNYAEIKALQYIKCLSTNPICISYPEKIQLYPQTINSKTYYFNEFGDLIFPTKIYVILLEY